LLLLMMLILSSSSCTFLIFAKREEFHIALSRVRFYLCCLSCYTNFIAGKARLGTVVHQKNAAILTLTDVRPEDKNALATLGATIKVLLLVFVALTYRPTTTINSLLSTLVTGVEENLDRRVWMSKQREQKQLHWLSRFRDLCCSVFVAPLWELKPRSNNVIETLFLLRTFLKLQF
jgi:hypothetical protein